MGQEYCDGDLMDSNVSKGLLSGILFRSTASSVWEDLRERFNKINLLQVYHLHKEIATLVQGTLPVSVYYSRLKDLWDEYDSIVPPPSCDCAKSKEYSENLQKHRLLQFLMGLNDGYSNARGQILMKTTPPSMNLAYALIVQDENQKSSSVGHFSSGEGMDPTALFAARGAPTRKFGDSYCDYCHMRGHTREQCFKLKFCDHCKSRGHLRETCYQLIGYPADFKSKKKANVVTRNGHSGELPQSQLSSGHGKQSEQSQLIQGNTIPKFFPPNQCAQIEQLLRKSSFGEASASMARTNVNIAGNTGSLQLPTGETTKVSSIGTCQLDERPAHWECEGDW
ncbi:uncharacterized protein LOC125861709 isoform X2 [Solanum stenotomum]|uniref:uncharacterized protein LOC125861709 isoform X2 n=1 Tax=Solanum stenotomum TaxID=172797 RepID=UPI0020D1B0D3|nr:uncharacterized protein LOC125861709 isoform X2 [Solanum stenotomum]